MSKLGSLVRERILILDGAMGTMIQQYNLTEEDFRGERFSQIPGQMKGNNDLLCLTRPDVIQDIHRKYLAAGADIIETNTFSSTRVSMADYHVQDYVREMNLAAVRSFTNIISYFCFQFRHRTSKHRIYMRYLIFIKSDPSVQCQFINHFLNVNRIDRYNSQQAICQA